MRVEKRVALVVIFVALVGLAPQALAQDKPEPLRFTAFAVNLNSKPSSGVVDITLERLSSDEERETLLAALIEKDQNALLKALQKVKPRVGYINLPGNLGWDLKYAYRFVHSDGSSRVVIATDRRIEMWEARNQPRTMDYPFTLIEMRLDKDNKGEGRLAYATKITKSSDGKTIELENYGISPVALNEIALRK